LLGRVGDGHGDDTLQGRDPQGRGGFLGHRSLLVRNHAKRVLPLQGFAAATRRD
jgi:hypothetical protein